ncbi:MULTISPECIES: hypothetical protein [Virgibacillus]|uniref:Uncharacterized protein n=2 Tax=Virgibacillus TaxID=84406 RepID=A0A024QBL2_9BACI|nr:MULTISPECIES: hypothetical protein [Virgibacillus]EQB36223.1 hypothetical protein M948_14405 [Virgibacillus sp. CM-4]MYL42094.1 hypothetical protein [Virgibacillus massiliensis]GGJ45650.1 hypothetical protein GCM10007111_04550 [Virgibacillus kapii]CDQ39923.1 hypothetical protein BN990_02240 [Virgibacillus massiliensis]
MPRANNLFPIRPNENGHSDNQISNKSTVRHSGNSDVDVNVIVDTTPMAYAMLCSMLASKQISDREFDDAVKKLDDLISKRKKPSVKEVNDIIRPNQTNR